MTTSICLTSEAEYIYYQTLPPVTFKPAPNAVELRLRKRSTAIRHSIVRTSLSDLLPQNLLYYSIPFGRRLKYVRDRHRRNRILIYDSTSTPFATGSIPVADCDDPATPPLSSPNEIA